MRLAASQRHRARPGRLRAGRLLLLWAALAAAGDAAAQTTRTWVSGVGDDTNPCSRTAPCLTLQGALAHTAAGGEIDALDPGEFTAALDLTSPPDTLPATTLTVTGPITIDGGGGKVAATSTGAIDAIVVAAGPTHDVVLRNLRLDGAGIGLNGIRFVSGRSLRIEGCEIHGFVRNGIDFRPAAGGRLAVAKTAVFGNGGAGILVRSGSPAALSVASLQNVRATGNREGVVARENATVTAVGGEASGNCAVGFRAASDTTDPALLSVERSRTSFNAYGLEAAAASTGVARVRVDQTAVTGNGGSGTRSIGAGVVLSSGTNRIAGNGSGAVPLNASPGFDPIAPLSLSPGAPLQNVAVTGVSPGPAEPGQTATITALSSLPALIPDPVVTGSGATWNLAFQPVAGQSGSATIAVSADDAQCVNAVYTRTFVVTVGAVNVAPSFVRGADVTVPQGSGAAALPGWAASISKGPANESWQSLAFLVTADRPDLFSVLPAIAPDGTLTFTPAPGAVGQAAVTVVLRDDGGTAGGGHDASAPQVFYIAIGQPLDLPRGDVPAIGSVGLAAFSVLLALAGIALVRGRPPV